MRIIITIIFILVSICVLIGQIIDLNAKENEENKKIFENLSKTLDNDKSDMV